MSLDKDYIASKAHEWKDRQCPHCKAVTQKRVRARPDTIHYAEVYCEVCNTGLGWLPKPDSKKSRPAASLNLAVKFGVEYCEWCLRWKDELPPGQTLHGHHKIEHQDGGDDTRENILVLCTFCHDSNHVVRRLIGHDKLPKKDGAA